MEFKIIDYGSDQYRQMVDLRHRVLRAPINCIATPEELAEDKHHVLLGAFFLNEGNIAGCCFLSHLNPEVVKLRQMAVDTIYQGRGLGKELLTYAERIAKLNGYKKVYLHARKTAIVFYEKHGYKVIGEPFTEVGIPHVEMIKNIEEY